jgi:hypothetical protein
MLGNAELVCDVTILLAVRDLLKNLHFSGSKGVFRTMPRQIRGRPPGGRADSLYQVDWAAPGTTKAVNRWGARRVSENMGRRSQNWQLAVARPAFPIDRRIEKPRQFGRPVLRSTANGGDEPMRLWPTSQVPEQNHRGNVIMTLVGSNARSLKAARPEYRTR